MSTHNTTNKNLPLATPDFDSIKDSLKDFLSAQDELKDYDFDGSSMSVVLDMLAYNTHMNAFMLNMIGNEAFLSTAVRRSSVVNSARDLGYTPTSAKSAYVYLYLEYAPISGIPEASILIPGGSVFGSVTNGASFLFSTLDDEVAVWVESKGRYVVDNVKAYEGRRFSHVYTVATAIGIGDVDVVNDVTGEGISIPNLNADSSTMRVYVNDPAISSEYSLFTQYGGALGVSNSSRVYFISEDDVGRVNVKFGDGVLGYKPGIGSKIKIEYIVSSGPKANGIALFNQTVAIEGATLSKAIPKSPASGGALPESIESIKYNAPLSFEAQDRGVIAEDYVYLTKQVYPNTRSVICWGGQDNDPPIFGKVFISVQPKTGVAITQSDKSTIAAHLSTKSMMTITPVITEPDYIYVDVSSIVRYDVNRARLIGGALEEVVTNAIRNYSETTLSTFKANLEFSRFLAMVDMSDPGILSNSSTLSLTKRIYVDSGIKQQAIVKFCNRISDGSVTSSRFSYSSFSNCRFSANMAGMMSIVSEQGGNTLTIVSDVGQVDYAAGTITIRPIVIDSLDQSLFDPLTGRYFITMSAKPQNLNITTKQNQILLIDKIQVKSEKA